MDAGVQDLQGKTERVRPAELLLLLEEFYRDRATLWRGHVASARSVEQYDVNNTYQYVIAREAEHLGWVRDAAADLGGTDAGDEPVVAPSEDEHPSAGGASPAADARRLDGFVETWGPRVASLAHARHRTMLQLILGETAEHARLFRQAGAGQQDLLGRRTGGERTGGRVLPTRWVE